METIHVILGIMILLAAGCEDQYRLVSLNRQIEVKWGREYVLDSGLSFTIEDVKDSRCPKGARCFRAGEAMVRLRIKSFDTEQTDTTEIIKLNRPGTDAQTYKEYRFALIDVLPYPDIESKYKKSDYKVLLKIVSIKP
ncbi:MAG: hypothetical protein V5A47_02985 [Bacteroidales bacterium]|nr:hypothetical protein [Bacteroidales bacterium]MBS3774685.1 hypothetical protein [Bacteroidales bacterium]